MPKLPAAIVLLVGSSLPLGADVLTFAPTKDNTMYANPVGNSNALGGSFSAGKSGAGDGFRRGLLAFDVGGIPTGARVDKVTLELRLLSAPNQETQSRSLSLHRLLADWGEGTSDAGSGSGTGTGVAATVGDATWVYRYFDSQTWASYDLGIPNSGGGDFLPLASASAVVGTNAAAGTVYSWETVRGGAPSGLVADVEAWLLAPGANFGWLLRIDDESPLRTVRQFSSRNDTTEENRPVLRIEFTPVPEPATLFLASVALGCLGLVAIRRQRTKR